MSKAPRMAPLSRQSGSSTQSAGDSAEMAPEARKALSVLHVTPYYPPDRIGGVGEVARIVHEGLVLRGIWSEVLTSGTTKGEALVHRSGRSPVLFASTVWRYARMAARFDVLHVHHGEAALLLLLLRGLRRRPAILMMCHVDVRRREAAGGPHRVNGRHFGPSVLAEIGRRIVALPKIALEHLTWRLADAVTVETECLSRELEDMRPTRTVRVIPLGVREPTAAGSVADDVDILYVGTAGNRKRTHLLPAVIHGVRESFPTARLRIIGFSRETDRQLNAEAVRLGVEEAIEFVGPLSPEQVPPYYRAADVLVVPSAYEGLPLVVLEGMREGLSVVATAVSGHPEAIDDGINGFLVPVDDVQSMVARCRELLASPALRARISKRASATVQRRYSVRAQLNAYVALYDSLLRAPN